MAESSVRIKVCELVKFHSKITNHYFLQYLLALVLKIFHNNEINWLLHFYNHFIIVS